MPVLKCPHCTKSMSVAETYLGKVVRCPSCAKTVQTAAPIPVAAPVSSGGVDVNSIGMALTVIAVILCFTGWFAAKLFAPVIFGISLAIAVGASFMVRQPLTKILSLIVMAGMLISLGFAILAK